MKMKTKKSKSAKEIASEIEAEAKKMLEIAKILRKGPSR